MAQREDVLRQAMALPADDRAYVVTVLERSLTNTAQRLASEPAAANNEFSSQALLAELERRSAHYRAGATAARPDELAWAWRALHRPSMPGKCYEET